MRDFDPFLEPFEILVTKFFDVSEAVHTTKNTCHDHEENFAEVMFFVSTAARVFDDTKGLEALRKTAGVINFIRISSHLASVRIPDMVYIFKSNKIPLSRV